MSGLLLSEDDVRQVLTMDLALEGGEEGLRKLGLGGVINIPRARAQTDHAMLHVLSAAAKTLGVMGYKAYTTSRKGAQFHVGLFDGKSGALLALIQADYLGQMRTGAASGVATEYMARPDASEVGLFGAGKQARTQAQAICTVRKIRRVQVYSLNEERRNRFADEMSEVCKTEVVPVPRPEMAAEDKDIVITATSSREPVFNGHWLAEGTHLNAIGSNFLGKAEIDDVAVRPCDTIVGGSKDPARGGAGGVLEGPGEGGGPRGGNPQPGPGVGGRRTP